MTPAWRSCPRGPPDAPACAGSMRDEDTLAHEIVRLRLRHGAVCRRAPPRGWFIVTAPRVVVGRACAPLSGELSDACADAGW